MTNPLIRYKLSDGYVHNWLVAGPQVQQVLHDSPSPGLDNFKLSVARRYFEPDLEITEPPVDLGPLGSVTQDDPLITWRYYRCREDHTVDFSAFHPACTYLRSWAYTRLILPAVADAKFVLATYGPADLWLNDRHISRLERFASRFNRSTPVTVTLETGCNEVLIRFDNVGVRETSYGIALQIRGISEIGAEVALPLEIEADLLEKRQNLEEVVEKASLDRYVYGFLDGDHYNRNEPILLRFSENLDSAGEITYRLQNLAGYIFQEGTRLCEAGTVIEMAKSYPLRNGPHHMALLPPAHEYYEKKIHFERRELFYVVRTPYAQKHSSNESKSAKKALEDAAQRRNNNLYCEISKMALGRWDAVDQQILDQAIDHINQRCDGSIFELLGLLGALMRFRKKRSPLEERKSLIEAGITRYRYGGEDLIAGDVMDLFSESRQIIFHVCEILAGQLLPDLVFERTGQMGRWHRERGENLAVTWLKQHGMYGFKEWDSPASVEAVLSALSHLVDLANSETICELASVLMDKMLFSLGMNSFKGAYGSSRGRSDIASVLSSRLEPTSGISRLMWGIGNFNENVMGTVSLACCQKYRLPKIIRKIARDHPSALWSLERQKGLNPPIPPSLTRKGDEEGFSDWEVNKVTYKTKDFMLSSAQDYEPGKKGHQEHIWQATLGPDAVVFVNHPTCMSVDDAHRPNLWVGNGVLPRVAQWGDILIAIHRLPEDDWLGFTHAYFPAAAFEEFLINSKWAFARVGKGYLALAAAQGLEFITYGQTAFRELRSYGNENIWLCHMGQELLDGNFEDFQRKMLAMEVTFDDLSVRVKSLRNDLVFFGWEGPWLVNGQEQPLSGFRHFENPYCVVDLPASQMDIVYQGEGIRLTFD